MKIHKYFFYYRDDQQDAKFWHKNLSQHLQSKYPNTLEVASIKDADLVIVLGGDGTIIEAAKLTTAIKSLLLGLNLGTVGFLASERNSVNFVKAIDSIFQEKFTILERRFMDIGLFRNKKLVNKFSALNDIVIQSLVGIVELELKIQKEIIQSIRGNGILVSTPTGSTAYNLSAHGPIVMPNIDCHIITELMDHNLPTPSLVIDANQELTINIKDFRKTTRFINTENNEHVDVTLGIDGKDFINLEPKDIIQVSKSELAIKCVDLEAAYFFKSLHERFSFK